MMVGDKMETSVFEGIKEDIIESISFAKLKFRHSFWEESYDGNRDEKYFNRPVLICQIRNGLNWRYGDKNFRFLAISGFKTLCVLNLSA